MLKPAVAEAVEALRVQFANSVDVTETGDGGCHVVVNAVALGAPYQQAETWFAFTIAPLYPYADIYPHFVRPDLARLDGAPLKVPVHPGNSFHGRAAVMVSRRTRLTGVEPNSAVLKLLKVQSWLLSQ